MHNFLSVGITKIIHFKPICFKGLKYNGLLPTHTKCFGRFNTIFITESNKILQVVSKCAISVDSCSEVWTWHYPLRQLVWLNQRAPKKNTSNFKAKKEKEKEKHSIIIIIPVTFVCIDELFPTSSSKKSYFTQDYILKINQNKNKNQLNSTRLVWLHHYMEKICKIVFISSFIMLITQ